MAVLAGVISRMQWGEKDGEQEAVAAFRAAAALHRRVTVAI